MLSFRRPPIGSTRLDRRADTKHIFPKRAVWFLALWIALPLFAPAHALEPVTLQLKWTHQFQFAGYYAALEKGYYREAGLEVKLAEAMPGQSAVDAVLENKAEFGVGTSELLLLRMRGKPVVVLGVIMQHSPIALLSHGPPRIQNIQDLAGRSIMIEPGSAELFAMLRREKLPDNASLRIESHNFDVRDVIKGRVDAMSVYVTDELYEVERQGIPHLLFRPLTSGIDFYGDNLFTTEAQIRDHPERVKAFRAASLKGWKYAMENPAEIIRLIRERYSRHKTQEHLEFEAAAMARLMQVGLIEPGYMYPGRWQHIADTYAEVGMIDRAADLKGFLYENDPAADHAWLYKSLGATLAGLLCVGLVALRYFRLSAAYQESEGRFRALFEQMPDPAWITKGHRFIEANQAALKVMGYNHKADFLSLHPSQLSPELQPDGEPSQAKAERHLQALESQSVLRFEWVHAKADGTQLPVEVTLTHITLRGERAVYCVWRDISERKQAEQALRAESEKNRALLINASDGIGILDSEGRLVEVSHSLCDMLGYRREELLGMHVSHIDAYFGNEELNSLIERQLETPTRIQFETRNRRKDGSMIDMEVSGLAVVLGDKKFVFNSSRDITERKRVEQKLRLAASVFNHANEGIVISGPDGTILDVNETFTRLSGYSRKEVIGKNPRLLRSDQHPPEFYAAMWRRLLEEGHWQGEVWNRRKNGERYAVRLTISEVRGPQTELAQYVSLFTDITAQKEYGQRLERLAHYDTLTGLPNRALFYDHLRTALALARRNGERLGVLFLDLDGFKAVNDQYGHEAGDELLKQAADRISDCVRESDMVARLAGDEFTLILGALTDPVDMQRVSEKIIEALNTAFQLGEVRCQIGASVGTALYPDDTDGEADMDALIRCADIAMYRAKAAGKGKIVRYSDPVVNLENKTQAVLSAIT